MTKFVAFSDTHGKHENLSMPKGDVLLFAGDANMETVSKTITFLKWIKNLPYKIKIIVAGNHDKIPYEDYSYFKELCKELNITYVKDEFLDEQSEGAFYLEDAGFTIKRPDRLFKVYGSPWSPTFLNWSFLKPEMKLKDIWQKIPVDTDILITHSPPKLINDTNKKDKHLGSTFLLQRVKFEMMINKPELHVFGHIHPNTEKNRKRFTGDTFLNVGVLDEQNKLKFQPTIITL